MSNAYINTEGTSGEIVSVSDEVSSSLNTDKVQIDIQASNYADQVYTLSYIENFFSNLNKIFDGCRKSINEAKKYITETASVGDLIELPSIKDFDFSITGTEILSEKNADINGIMTGNVNVKTSLNFREGPGTNSKIIGSLPNDAKLTILSEDKGWLHVKKEDGTEGYVFAKYVKMNKSNQNSSSNDSTTTINENINNTYAKVNINSGHLNVRSSPNGTILGGLEKDTKIEVIGHEGNWTKIKYNGQEAYVYSKYIEEL